MGIIAALPAEGRCLTGRRIAPLQPLSLDQGVWLYVSGIGEDQARAAAERLLLEGAQALVSWGTAGALAAGLTPGALVLPSAAVHTTGTFPVDSIWRERLSRRLGQRFNMFTGVLAHSAKVLTSPEEKIKFHRKTAAVAVDMESAAIGAAAARAQVPFLAVRSIVDSQGMELPRYAIEAVDEYGKTRWRKLLSGLWANPASLRSLIQLGVHFQAALATLRNIVQLTGPRLCYEERI